MVSAAPHARTSSRLVFQILSGAPTEPANQHLFRHSGKVRWYIDPVGTAGRFALTQVSLISLSTTKSAFAELAALRCQSYVPRDTGLVGACFLSSKPDSRTVRSIVLALGASGTCSGLSVLDGSQLLMKL